MTAPTLAPNFFSSQASALVTPSLRKVSIRIAEIGGINLGQGVCLLPVPKEVVAAAHAAIDAGVNRYTNPAGLLSLRTAISHKLDRHNKVHYDPETEIVITHGATGAFEGVCATMLNPGDAVVSFSPFYPYYDNSLRRYGVEIHYVNLHAPNWEIAWDEFDRAMTPNVKFVLVNTPGNPTGKVFSKEELTRIGKSCKANNALIVTDEIYEYMTYDGHTHTSAASLPGLKDHTITIGGYSKTFAITGWRIGFLAAPRHIIERLVAVVDNIYVCAPAPLQQGVATAIDHFPDSFYSEMNEMYARKRQFFCDAIEKLGLKVMRPQGAYYVMADFSSFAPELNALEFVDRMIERTKVGAVPANDFVPDAKGHQWVRFCVAVPDEDLAQAVEQLKQL